MRMIWFGFVLSGVMLIYVVFVVPVRTPDNADAAIEIGMTMIALVDVVLGFLAQRFLARIAKPVPEGRQGNAELNAWLSRNVASLALIYSCNLFAFALHMLRAGSDLVDVLFGVGMISLLLWQPGTPPVVKAGKIARE